MQKTVLITGCSSGIGMATAKLFAQRGWVVFATARDVEYISKELACDGIYHARLDVTKQEDIDAVYALVQEQAGHLDCIVNNAGFGSIGPFEAASDEDIRRQFDVNVFGVMSLVKTFLPMLRASKGTVISVSSIGGKFSLPLYSLYNSTKWALEGFMESLQYELLEHNVRVKLVEPGPIKSEFYGSSQKLLKKANLNMYNEIVSRVYPVVQRAGTEGGETIDVAKVIFKAARSRSERLRYSVGSAGVLLLLRKVTPDVLFFWIIKRVFRV